MLGLFLMVLPKGLGGLVLVPCLVGFPQVYDLRRWASLAGLGYFSLFFIYESVINEVCNFSVIDDEINFLEVYSFSFPT